jgi:two-component system, cell cycle response regulator DivK
VQKPNILYVEDDAPSRRIMQILLGLRMGIENLTIFEDSRDFLVRAEAINPKPDVIFLDIHLQPHNGFELLKMLRASSILSGTRIVALTASVMNEEVLQLRVAGFDGCLGKPINIDTFPETLQAILAGQPIWQILS